MSDSHVQNSHIPSLERPKQVIPISGISYPGLGLSQYVIDDHVELVLKGSVKGTNKPSHGRGAVDITLTVEEIKDITPRKDRDLDNRIR